MLLLVFLLIPAILAVEKERIIDHHILKIDGDTLISANPTETPWLVLNLSGMGLRIIQENAFENLTTVKLLELDNNFLSSIPKRLFAKLGNLEHLSLANNNFTTFEKVFEGLDHLETLNISNNPINTLEATALSGLRNSSVVHTKGLSIKVMNAFVFEKKPGLFFKLRTFVTRPSNDQNSSSQAQIEHSVEIKARRRRDISENVLITICMDGDVLKRVEPLQKDETLPTDCRRRELTKYRDVLDLQNLGIAKFEKNWYRLNSTTPISVIQFAGNNIVRVTPELMNDLPENVGNIDLRNNKIERLEKDVLENTFVRTVNLSSNAIREIEDGAFAKLPGLSELYLDDNLLTNTRFMATLPAGMQMLLLQNNKITEISPGSFSTVSRLMYIYLNGNLIQEVKSDSFRGLSFLMELILSDNRISKIEPGSFQQIGNVYSIALSNNSISGFENGTFDNLRGLHRLDVSWNKLSDIRKSFPNGLPSTLTVLNLGFNGIEKLERAHFENLPLRHLILSGNKISEIKRGVLRLPRLKSLKLDNNRLALLRTDSFRDLKRMEKLDLGHNGITRIPPGFTRDMDNLDELDLSYNPIQRLQNGALYGFRKTSYNEVYLSGVPVEVIEAGLFDET